MCDKDACQWLSSVIQVVSGLGPFHFCHSAILCNIALICFQPTQIRKSLWRGLCTPQKPCFKSGMCHFHSHSICYTHLQGKLRTVASLRAQEAEESELGADGRLLYPNTGLRDVTKKAWQADGLRRGDRHGRLSLTLTEARLVYRSSLEWRLT